MYTYSSCRFPQVRVHGVRFSPAGESFAVVSTEGLLLYSQAAGLDGTFRLFTLHLSLIYFYFTDSIMI